jgi:ABC-type antimicrobial peptide transport system permease subunit
MPWGSLLIIGLLGVLCGIVAGVLPARRAAKMNVLDAIASE